MDNYFWKCSKFPCHCEGIYARGNLLVKSTKYIAVIQIVPGDSYAC